MGTELGENINIIDSKGFIYEVSIRHCPHFGFSTAFYKDRIIAQVELGRLLQPAGDNDGDWEAYEERYAEWIDEIKSNMIPKCQTFFNERACKSGFI